MSLDELFQDLSAWCVSLSRPSLRRRVRPLTLPFPLSGSPPPMESLSSSLPVWVGV